MAAVEAHITGTVWMIECRIAQEVEEGETLVVLTDARGIAPAPRQ